MDLFLYHDSGTASSAPGLERDASRHCGTTHRALVPPPGITTHRRLSMVRRRDHSDRSRRDVIAAARRTLNRAQVKAAGVAGHEHASAHVIVTGSSGLIGSEVVKYFCSRGWEVHGVQ